MNKKVYTTYTPYTNPAQPTQVNPDLPLQLPPLHAVSTVSPPVATRLGSSWAPKVNSSLSRGSQRSTCPAERRPGEGMTKQIGVELQRSSQDMILISHTKWSKWTVKGLIPISS